MCMFVCLYVCVLFKLVNVKASLSYVYVCLLVCIYICILYLSSVRMKCFVILTILHHVRDIKDPEHPYSLEELKVVSEDAIEVNDEQSHVTVTFTPTVEHCSMATVIGLCIRVKLMRSLPSHYKVDIRVAPGTHATETAVNKQLNDKERVAAALENPNLLEMVDECLAPTYS
ncbi:protein AE7-like isoform X1 [Tasmannia lanceolata]|uniref:protein AE7-like isoform X1 n=1 Tax=Tasmannia lanceolata TaxID=3420 RepID=UPI0040632C6F